MDFQLNKIQVFCSTKDKNPDNDVEIVMHKATKYDDVAAKVGSLLGADPEKIQFFVASAHDEPKAAIRRNPNMTLDDMLHGPYSRPIVRPRLFYEVLDISLAELESKRLIKITLCTPTLKDCKSAELWMPKQARISDLLKELEAQGAKFESQTGTRSVRVFEAVNNRFHREFLVTDSLSQVSDSHNAQLYAEELPQEELDMGDEDIFIPVFHYQRDISRTHSVPFKFLVRKDEPFHETKKRLQARTGIPDKEWSKVKFSIVSAYSAAPIDDGKFNYCSTRNLYFDSTSDWHAFLFL